MKRQQGFRYKATVVRVINGVSGMALVGKVQVGHQLLVWCGWEWTNAQAWRCERTCLNQSSYTWWITMNRCSSWASQPASRDAGCCRVSSCMAQGGCKRSRFGI